MRLGCAMPVSEKSMKTMMIFIMENWVLIRNISSVTAFDNSIDAYSASSVYLESQLMLDRLE